MAYWYSAPRRCVFLAAATVAAVTLAGCPAPVNQKPIRVVVTDNSDLGAARPAESDVIQLAKREGELVWYTSMPEEPARGLLRLFEAKHPYITTRLVRESTFDVIRRLEDEIQTGRVQADLLHILDVAIFVKLKRQGQLLRYSSPEERFIPAAYKDPGYWLALRLVSLCIAYVPERIKPHPPPQHWLDLLEPRWKGRIGLKDAQTAGSAYAEYYFLREQYGVSYWKRMAAQRPKIYKTAEESMEALLAGEVDIVSGAMDYSVQEARESGKPVAAVWPPDGVPVMLGPIAILRSALHPNAARLFLDFAVSREGQMALRELMGSHSPRSDVPPPGGAGSWPPAPMLTPEAGWEQYADNQDTLRAEYTRLFHPGSE